VKSAGEQYFGYPELPSDITDVMMVDDMIDEGVTGKDIADHFAKKDISFRSAVFFQKIKERKYTADIVLHDIDDEWVNQPFETKYE
jgi:hypoxanthine-guanine phosphoribosyltransferase